MQLDFTAITGEPPAESRSTETVPENIEAAILNGLQEGERLDVLFLKAIKALGDESFYITVKRDLWELYRLGRPIQPEAEIEELLAQNRQLEDSYEAAEDSEAKERIKQAFKKHCQRAASLHEQVHTERR